MPSPAEHPTGTLSSALLCSLPQTPVPGCLLCVLPAHPGGCHRAGAPCPPFLSPPAPTGCALGTPEVAQEKQGDHGARTQQQNQPNPSRRSCPGNHQGWKRSLGSPRTNINHATSTNATSTGLWGIQQPAFPKPVLTGIPNNSLLRSGSCSHPSENRTYQGVFNARSQAETQQEEQMCCQLKARRHQAALPQKKGKILVSCGKSQRGKANQRETAQNDPKSWCDQQ